MVKKGSGVWMVNKDGLLDRKMLITHELIARWNNIWQLFHSPSITAGGHKYIISLNFYTNRKKPMQD